MAKHAAIHDLAFRHNLKTGLGFELMRLSDLFERAARNAIVHPLEMPQRPEFHTVYVGLRGRGKLVIDFNETPLGESMLTVVARGRVQQFVPARGLDAWMLVFSPEFIELGEREIDPLRNAAVLAPSWSVPSLAFGKPEQREIFALIDQMAAEQQRELDALQPAVLSALLRAVLLRCERLLRAGRDAPLPSVELERFLIILERDCLRTRSVAHYARATGISTRRLGEMLGEHTGRSTKQVIDGRVVLEMKRLLVHTDISVKELADYTGFAEPTNLVKFFRHHTNSTPLEFRAANTFSPSRRRS